jgi:thiamine biosynthesis lipoprotein
MSEELSRFIPLLGGKIEAVLYGLDESSGEKIFCDLEDEAIRLQKICDFYDFESELNHLNNKRSIHASPELLEVIKMALPYCARTGGKFDITLGKQIIQRKKGEEITQINSSYKDILIAGNRIILTHPDAVIDLGSVAKGYIGDKLAGYAKKRGAPGAFFDLRGDLIFFGERVENIGVEHPRQKGELMHSFKTSNSGIATSGDYRQYFGDYNRSHIINSKDLCSVTVVADTLAEANLLSSSIFVSGTEALEKYSDERFYAVDESLNVHKSNGFP